MINNQWIYSELVPAFFRMLMHSLWQGLVGAILAGIMIAMTKKTSARLRYKCLLAIFGGLLLVSGITFIRELKSPVASSSKMELVSVASLVTPASTTGYSTEAAANEINLLSAVFRFINDQAMLLSGIWLFLFLFQLTKIIFGLRHIQRLRHLEISDAGADWKNWLRDQCEKLGVDARVTLMQSALVKVPVAIGFLKPMILVPVGLLNHLSARQVESILLHELAHISRKDYFVNLVQSLVEAVYFFNPALLWISSLIREERETCCDDLVITHTSNKNDYLDALVSFQELQWSKSYTMALGKRKHVLLDRVRRILTKENSNLTRKEVYALLAGILLIGSGVMSFKTKDDPVFQSIQTQKTQTGWIPQDLVPVIKETKKTAYSAEPSKKVYRAETIKDTLPKKTKELKPVHFTNISTNIVDDGKGKTSQILATQDNGTRYRIRKVDNEITEFSVNDKEIPKENYKDYDSIIKALDNDNLKRKKAELKKLEYQTNKLNAENRMRQSRLNKLNAQKTKLRVDSLKKLRNVKLHKANPEVTKQKNKFHSPDKKFLVKGDSPKLNPVSNTLTSLINELVSRGLAKSDKEISFTLNSNELIVDGKTVSKEVFEEIRSRYLKSPEDRFRYSRHGNSTSSEIYIK